MHHVRRGVGSNRIMGGKTVNRKIYDWAVCNFSITLGHLVGIFPPPILPSQLLHPCFYCLWLRTYSNVCTSYARTQHGSFLVLASYVCNPQFMSPTWYYCFFSYRKHWILLDFYSFFIKLFDLPNRVRFRQISISETCQFMSPTWWYCCLHSYGNIGLFSSFTVFSWNCSIDWVRFRQISFSEIWIFVIYRKAKKKTVSKLMKRKPNYVEL